MEIIVFLGVVLVLIGFKLWWDSRAKDRGRIINHLQSGVIDFVIYSFSAWQLFGIKNALGWVIVGLGIRWIIFDPLYAKINWDTWHVHGTSSKLDVFLMDGITFKFRKKHYTILKLGKWHFVIKLIPVAVGIFLILIPKS